MRFLRSVPLLAALATGIALVVSDPAFAGAVRVLRSTPEFVDVEFTDESVRFERLAGENGVSFRRPTHQEAVYLGEAGEPDVPSILKLVGIPDGSAPSVRVLSVETERVVLPDLAPVAREQADVDAKGQGVVHAVRSAADRAFERGLTPAAWASFEGRLSVRGQRLVRLALHPWRYEADRAELVRAKRLVVRVELGAPAAARPGVLGAAGTPRARRDVDEWERTLDRLVLNADVARTFRTDRASALGEVAPRAGASRPDGVRSEVLRSGGGDSFDSSPNWLRVPIEAAGLHVLDYFTFANAGVDPATVNPTTIRVFAGTNLALPESLLVGNRLDFMEECSILDLGDSDLIFDLEDRFLFHALTPNGWGSEYDPARSRTEHVENIYTDTSYYWITWAGAFSGPPKRMGARAVAPSAGPFATVAPHRVHFEQNNAEEFRYRDEDGWLWEDLQGRGRDREFFLRLDGVASGDGTVSARLLSWGSSVGDVERRVQLKVGGTVVADSSWIHGRDTAIVDLEGAVSGGFRSGTNSVIVNVVTSSPLSDDKVYLSHFDIEYERALAAEGGALISMFADPGSSDWQLSGFSSNEVFLFDVSEQHDPVRLTGFSATGSGTVNVRFSDPGQTTTRWYSAATLAGVRSLPPAEVVAIRGLRAPGNRAEFVVLYHPSLQAGAERLASIRRAAPGWQNRPVLTVDLFDVYNEFSWGMVDATAIRDFAAHAFANWDVPPMFLTLVGDAAYDTKGYLDGSPDNLIPSYVGRYRNEPGSVYDDGLNLRFYTTEDFYGYLETADYSDPFSQPALDIAIGRYPERDPAVLDLELDKLESYVGYDAPGQWQNRVIIVADDERVLDPNSREPIHTQQAEKTSAEGWYPPALDKVKVYLTEYPFNDFGKKPAAQRKYIEEFTRGALIASYTGHGDQNTMAQEEVFVSQKIPELLNENRYPIFDTFSCTVSKFDLLSGNSMTELMLKHEGGGSVGSFSSGGLVFPNPSFNLHTTWLQEVFGTPYPVATFARSVRPIGIAGMSAKVIQGVNGTVKQNNEKYVLLGDPALEHRFGKHLVTFDPPTVTTNTRDGFLRLIRGRIHDEAGNVLDGTNGTTPFSGTAWVHVTENADTSGYLYDTGYIPYDLEGPTNYRGEIPVTDGRFEVRFYISETVPSGNSGRVSVFALEDGMMRAGSGAFDSLAIAPTISAGDVTDREGPRIRIRFVGYENFVDGDLVFNDKPVLLVSLQDASGINLRPFPQFARLEAEIDGRDRVDLSEDFAYLDGTFTDGQVRRILPLAPGRHTLEVKAFDNVGNRSSTAVSFTIVDDGTDFALIDQKTAFYPNPFQDSVNLAFSLTRSAEVRLKIFTIAGRLVFETRPQMALEGDGNRIFWNGQDNHGNPLANGTYLYKLEATSTDTEGALETDEIVGTVVKMR